MGFYLVPFRQPNPPTLFLSVTGHCNVSFPSGASLWPGRRSIYNNRTLRKEGIFSLWSAEEELLFFRESWSWNGSILEMGSVRGTGSNFGRVSGSWRSSKSNGVRKALLTK